MSLNSSVENNSSVKQSDSGSISTDPKKILPIIKKPVTSRVNTSSSNPSTKPDNSRTAPFLLDSIAPVVSLKDGLDSSSQSTLTSTLIQTDKDIKLLIEIFEKLAKELSGLVDDLNQVE